MYILHQHRHVSKGKRKANISALSAFILVSLSDTGVDAIVRGAWQVNCPGGGNALTYAWPTPNCFTYLSAQYAALMQPNMSLLNGPLSSRGA